MRIFGLQSASSQELNGLTGRVLGCDAEKKTFVNEYCQNTVSGVSLCFVRVARGCGAGLQQRYG